MKKRQVRPGNSINPYDLNAIAEDNEARSRPRRRNPRDENPYSLTINRHFESIYVDVEDEDEVPA